jgi:bla regulator protein BlaR1
MRRTMGLGACGFLAIAVPVAFGIVRMIPLQGQILHAAGPLPSFEVATIKPWVRPAPPPPPPEGTPDTRPKPPARVAPGNGGGQATDRVHMITSTRWLIGAAYNVPFGFESRIEGGPDWVKTEQYEIQAKIEGSQFAAMRTMTAAEQRRQVDLMEQSLLADRFKLKVHFETREMPGYALVIAKGGPKLTPAKEGEVSMLSGRTVDQGSQMTAMATTIDQWIHSPFLAGPPVVDQTGLKGAYDFTLTWGLDEMTGARAGQEGVDAPSLFRAIQEQLGLRLVPIKTPVEFVVVDQIERPSEN